MTDTAGRPLTWNRIRRWARNGAGFPLMRGGRRGPNYYASITSEQAIIVWLLSQHHAGGLGFRVFKANANRRENNGNGEA